MLERILSPKYTYSRAGETDLLAITAGLALDNGTRSLLVQAADPIPPLVDLYVIANKACIAAIHLGNMDSHAAAAVALAIRFHAIPTFTWISLLIPKVLRPGKWAP